MEEGVEGEEEPWTLVGEWAVAACRDKPCLTFSFSGSGEAPIDESGAPAEKPLKKAKRERKKAKRDRGGAGGEEEDGEEAKTSNQARRPDATDTLQRFGAEGEFDDERTVFAGGVPYQASREDIVSFFSEAGTVERVRMMQYRGKSNGAAFVELASAEEAQRAAAMDGETFLGRRVRVNLATEKPGARRGLSVYVGNLAFTTSEKLLRAIFGHCGDIVQLKLPLFRDSGKLRGFAIVDLDTEAARQRALQLNGMKVSVRNGV
jgi:nucleolin